MARHSRDQAVDFKASPARLAGIAGRRSAPGLLTTIALGFERFAFSVRCAGPTSGKARSDFRAR